MSIPRFAHSALPWIAASLIGAAIVIVPLTSNGNPAHAKDEAHSLFLSITGEGPTAKAWYDEAPPAGVPIQDALDKFSAEGYRIVKVTEPHGSTTGGFVWSILMERTGK